MTEVRISMQFYDLLSPINPSSTALSLTEGLEPIPAAAFHNFLCLYCNTLHRPTPGNLHLIRSPVGEAKGRNDSAYFVRWDSEEYQQAEV